MKNYFRYGYDSWMIGMTIVILIVEALGFFLGGENAYDPFANIPFWLLTLYIISMIAMFRTACFIVNEGNSQQWKGYKLTSRYISTAIFACTVICEIIIIIFVYPEGYIIASLGFPISLAFMGIARINWTCLPLAILCFISQILVLTLELSKSW